jgi:hypothetical protein
MPSPKTNIVKEICQIALEMVNVANDNQLLLDHLLTDFWLVLGEQHMCITKIKHELLDLDLSQLKFKCNLDNNRWSFKRQCDFLDRI